jgi:ubiquinone/menaquinone biosynthesis C-methylase UbiE
LDLTAEYCAVGETLTAWTNLEDLVSFVNGNALAMPFSDGSFDAWMIGEELEAELDRSD